MSQQQVDEIEQRQALQCPIHIHHMDNCEWCNRIAADVKYAVDAVDLEAPLQEQIEKECRKRGWVCVRTRTDCANTFTMAGVVDMIVAAPNAKVYWIECKSRQNKQTPEQIGFQMLLNRNGHVYHLCRSFSQFLEIVKDA